MLNYEKLSDEISARIKNDRENGFAGNLAFNEENVIRRNNNKDKANIIRTAFIRDIDKIIHCPYYNRYIDKKNVRKLVPGTLEGCVMRISDIIAYLGKDRQDAEKASMPIYFLKVN